nr:hypothetical protein [uncultured Acetobacterium sp.]
MKNGRNSIMKKSVATAMMAVFLFSIALPSSAFAQDEMTTTATVGVEYKTHVQDKGWESVWKTNGVVSGTVGEGKRLEALEVQLSGDFPSSASIETYVHVQNRGNLGPFYMGSDAGTEGAGLRLESIRLVLTNMPGYVLKYNVQVQNKGWLRNETDDSTWFQSGETAGTAGEGLRLEGIRIKLVQVNAAYEAYLAALAAVSQDDYTVASWDTYQNVVNANTVRTTDSTTTINRATTAIQAAQKNLVKGKNLTAYKAALAAVSEVEYIQDTWDTYMEVVNANVVTQANTQIEINEATNNILLAQKKLQKKVDLTKYRQAVDSVRVADYASDSWVAYQKILAAYQMTENNSQEEVDNATTKIVEAQKKMARKFDFTAYKTLLAAVKEDDYTTISWTAYQKIVDANYIDTEHLSEDATQTAVEKAIKAIEASQKLLVKAGDLTVYEAVVEAAQKDDYMAKSWTTYQKVLDANKMTKNNTQAEIDAAVVKIVAAQKKLLPAGDLAEYEATLAKVDEADYTSKSWEAYQKIVKLNAVTAGSGQDAINTAVEKITIAQTALIKKGDLTEYQILLSSKTEENYTTASWAAYQKVVKANVMTTDNSKDEINAAIKKIETAQGNLAAKGQIGVYNDLVNSFKEELYTSASWATFKKVLDANEMSTDNNDTEIKAAASKIKAAASKLVFKVTADDYAAYEKIFNEKNEDLYTVASWTIYKKVLMSNIMTRDSSKVQVEAAVNKIRAAQFNLVIKGDLTAYNAALNTYKDKEAESTTTSWTAYQKVVTTNVMTSENSKSQIELATAKIVAAGNNLVKGTDLKYYKELLGLVKEADYTPASWAVYMNVVLQNQVSKDNTFDQVTTAMNNIRTAQSKLVNAGDLTAFLDCLKLYQENKVANDAYKANATTESWNAYANLVESVASFDKTKNYEWIAAGTKAGDITSASAADKIKSTTSAINAAKLKITLTGDIGIAYAEYVNVANLDAGMSKENYTVDSYTIYAGKCSDNDIGVPVKSTVAKINAATAAIKPFKDSLLLRASKASTDRFDAEISTYGTLKQTMTWSDDLNAYVAATSKYTIGSWTPYEALYKKYTFTVATMLHTDNNTEADYDNATTALVKARWALVEYKSDGSTGANLISTEIGSQNANTNIIAVLKAKLSEAGFNPDKCKITIISTSYTGSASVSGAGVLTGGTGDTAKIKFTIEPLAVTSPDVAYAFTAFDTPEVTFTIK